MERVTRGRSSGGVVLLWFVLTPTAVPLKVWLVLVLLLACAGLGVFFLLDRAPSAPMDLVEYLPDKAGTVLYVDVDALRKSGILGMIAGSKAAEDLEYKEFIEQTGFDYRHDLDGFVATFRGGQVFFAVRGRLDWDKLAAYARKRGGSCKGTYCVADGSQPGRRVSFHKLRSNLIGLAVSPDDMAAYQISRNASKVSPFSPDAPIWVMVPSAVLKEADSLPAGTRAFALALQNADRAIFSIGPDADHLKIAVNVTCQDVDAASKLLVQLENTTSLLRRMLAQEHREANASDLSGVLVAGTFRREDRKVSGEWPVQRAFVESITGSHQ